VKVGGESYATAAHGAPLENRRIGLFPEEEADPAAALSRSRRCTIRSTSPPVLRFGAVPDELRRRREHVVVERLLVDREEDRNRSPVARDQNGLAGFFELFEHSGGTVGEVAHTDCIHR
jgi:hypothetical protein